MERSSLRHHLCKAIWLSRLPPKITSVRQIGNREFANGEPGGMPLYSHAFVACELKPNVKSLVNLVVVLRPRCDPVTGRITAP